MTAFLLSIIGHSWLLGAVHSSLDMWPSHRPSTDMTTYFSKPLRKSVLKGQSPSFKGFHLIILGPLRTVFLVINTKSTLPWSAKIPSHVVYMYSTREVCPITFAIYCWLEASKSPVLFAISGVYTRTWLIGGVSTSGYIHHR